MSCRPTTEQDRAAIKAAVRRLIRNAGGQTEAAACTRVGQPALSRYGSVTHPDDQMPVDVLMDLTIDADDPDAIRTLCRLANGVFVPQPLARACATNWPAAVGASVRRGAEAAEAICTALNDDGRVTPEEIEDLEIHDKLSAAIEALVVLQTYARTVEG